MSRHSVSSKGRLRWSRYASFVDSIPPNLIMAWRRASSALMPNRRLSSICIWMWLSISSSSSRSLRCLLNKPPHLAMHSRSLLISDKQVGLKRPLAFCCYIGNPYEQGLNCTCTLKNGFSCDPGVQKAGEDGRRLLPFLGFFFDLLSARSRQLIKLRLP